MSPASRTSRIRKYKFDNIRFLLIFLVVYAHFMELAPTRLYYIIYSFHVPALLFVSGYFARFDRKKILLRIAVPYVLFQVLYILADNAIFVRDPATAMQFHQPYWLLWYLLVLLYDHILIPLFDVKGWPARCAVLAASVGLALLAGFDDSIGYDLSLSRFFVFLPFFIAGYYMGHPERRETENNGLPAGMRIPCALAAGAAAAACAWYLWNRETLTNRMFYGSFAYKPGEYTIYTRAMLMFIAAVWIAFFLLAVPDRKIPIVSVCGRYTMPVYLLHGFLRLYVQGRMKWLQELGKMRLTILFAVVALAIVLAFGNPYVGGLFNLLTGSGRRQRRRRQN